MLGEGAYGKVYVATDSRDSSKVAVKIFGDAITADHPTVKQEFQMAETLNNHQVLIRFVLGLLR